MDYTSKPPMADNAEPSAKCPTCGNTVNVGMAGEETYCPICGRAMDLKKASLFEASNEEY
jgi:endogenous inhibitor of DNA gyrase (YacG/DUF329 family)